MPVLFIINLFPVTFYVKCSTQLTDTTKVLVTITAASVLGQ